MTTDELLNRAIADCKAGRKAEARRLLWQILQRDKSNEAAWLWLSGTLEAHEQRMACLEKVLAINPGNEVARRGLERLRASTKAPSSSTASRPEPSSRNVTLTAPPKVAPANGRQSLIDSLLRLAAGLVIGGLVAVLVYGVISWAQDSSSNTSSSDSSQQPSAQNSEWEKFISEKGKFSIWMPGTPKSDVQTVSTPAGVLQLYLFVMEKDDLAYMVGYTDYPESLVRNADVDAMLDGARDGAVANVSGTLIDERRIRLDGYPGREIWIEAVMAGQKGLAEARIFLVGRRLYQVLAAGPKEGFSKSKAEKCLDSFRLLR